MRAVLIPVEGDVEIIDVPNTLEALQYWIEGPIETVAFGGEAIAIVNEEGRLKGMAENVGATYLLGQLTGYPIVGPCLFVGKGADGEFADVPEAICKLEGRQPTRATIAVDDLELGGSD